MCVSAGDYSTELLGWFCWGHPPGPPLHKPVTHGSQSSNTVFFCSPGTGWGGPGEKDLSCWEIFLTRPTPPQFCSFISKSPRTCFLHFLSTRGLRSLDLGEGCIQRCSPLPSRGASKVPALGSAYLVRISSAPPGSSPGGHGPHRRPALSYIPLWPAGGGGRLGRRQGRWWHK